MGDKNNGDVKFKRACFGGFKRADVMSYIEKLQTELFKCREENERLQSFADEQISKLGKELSAAEARSNEQISSLRQELARLTLERDEAIGKLKSGAVPDGKKSPETVLGELSALKSELSRLKTGSEPASPAPAASAAISAAAASPEKPAVNTALKAETDKIAELVARFTK